jgi:hypothetical protein
MRVEHHSTFPCGTLCKSLNKQDLWEFVTCKKCLKHKPEDLVLDEIIQMRRNCQYSDEFRYLYINALKLISDGHKPASEIAYAALTGELRKPHLI